MRHMLRRTLRRCGAQMFCLTFSLVASAHLAIAHSALGQDADSNTDETTTPSLAELKAAIEQQEAAIAAVEVTAEEMMLAQFQLEEEDEEPEVLRIYGFLDVGFQRVWMDDSQIISAYLPTVNASSFVVGNINTYLDIQPHPDWRALIELRFTSAPHGELGSLGGLAGTFSRVSTEQFDPHSPTVNSPMWGGYTVIERAHVDYSPSALFNLRVGRWFTPFGIWNIDHGTPTLITLAAPETILLAFFPLRQTGLMLYGLAFVGDWELGYTATMSNGRQDFSNFSFDDTFGFGGRVYAALESDGNLFKLGLSGYRGTDSNKIVDAVFVDNAVGLDSYSTIAYDEWSVGADVSANIGSLRVRAEATLRRINYERGKHDPGVLGATVPGTVARNRFDATGYILASYRLPVLGLEPFAILDSLYYSVQKADTAVIPGVGLTIHFNSSVQWKAQLNRYMNFDAEKGSDQSHTNSTAIFSRLIIVY